MGIHTNVQPIRLDLIQTTERGKRLDIVIRYHTVLLGVGTRGVGSVRAEVNRAVKTFQPETEI